MVASEDSFLINSGGCDDSFGTVGEVGWAMFVLGNEEPVSGFYRLASGELGKDGGSRSLVVGWSVVGGGVECLVMLLGGEIGQLQDLEPATFNLRDFRASRKWSWSVCSV